MPMNDSLSIVKGTCLVVLAYDIGAGIDLDHAESQIQATKERIRIPRTRAEPQYFDYRPPPLRVTQEIPSLIVDQQPLFKNVEMVLYDFGAVSVIFRLPLEGAFVQGLQRLSESLYEHAAVQELSRNLIDGLIRTMNDAIERPSISPFMEDYTIFHVEEFSSLITPEVLLTDYRQDIAQILRTEDEQLSQEEVHDSTSYHISFGIKDVTIIDWNAALIFGSQMADVIAVMEFANVQLLESRFLDQQLDDALDAAYDALSRKSGSRFLLPGSFKKDLNQIAGLQVDGAILFEQMTNALKLLGDQYLARVYRLTAKRFHLESWNASIIRKLDTIEGIYDKLSDQKSTQRMEVLEWIIIVLIAVSILLPFIPGFPKY